MINSINEIGARNEGDNRIDAKGFLNQSIENIPQIQSNKVYEIKLQKNNQKMVALPKNSQTEKKEEKYSGIMDAE